MSASSSLFDFAAAFLLFFLSLFIPKSSLSSNSTILNHKLTTINFMDCLFANACACARHCRFIHMLADIRSKCDSVKRRTEFFEFTRTRIHATRALFVFVSFLSADNSEFDCDTLIFNAIPNSLYTFPKCKQSGAFFLLLNFFHSAIDHKSRHSTKWPCFVYCCLSRSKFFQ